MPEHAVVHVAEARRRMRTAVSCSAFSHSTKRVDANLCILLDERAEHTLRTLRDADEGLPTTRRSELKASTLAMGAKVLDRRAVSRLCTHGMVALFLGAALAGCGGGGGGDDPAPTPPATPPANQSLFQQVQSTVLTPNCTGCHVGAGAPAGLRLDAANSFAMLVNVASTQVPTLLRVSPGDPDNSYLVQKIEGRAAVGGRMPLGRDPLPQTSIDLVRSWIAAGAQMNSAVDDGSFSIQSTIPAADEMSVAAVKELQVIFNSEIDSSLVSSAGIRIEASGGDGSFADGNEVMVPIADARVSPANARVLMVYPTTPLIGDDYRLVIDEAAGISLADNAARPLDGDGDGQAGGAFILTFRGALEAQ